MKNWKRKRYVKYLKSWAHYFDEKDRNCKKKRMKIKRRKREAKYVEKCGVTEKVRRSMLKRRKGLGEVC